MLTDGNIEDLKQRIRKFKPNRIDETKTCDELIIPILKKLGWYDNYPARIETQYFIPKLQNDNNGKVDYALLTEDGNPVVLVEAKQLSNQLGCEELEQLKGYGSDHIWHKGNKDLAFLVLTNGDVWKFYPLWHTEGLSYYGDWGYELSIEKGDIFGVKEKLNKLLIYQDVTIGNSRKYLEDLFDSRFA